MIKVKGIEHYSKVGILKGLRARLHEVRNGGEIPMFLMEQQVNGDPTWTPDSPGYHKFMEEYHTRIGQEEMLQDMINCLQGDPSSLSRKWEKANKKRTRKARRQADKKYCER